MDIAGGGQAEPALQGRAEVRQDVAEQIVRDDTSYCAGFEHHEHRHRVDVLVVRLDPRVTAGDFREDSLPQVAAEALDV